jgi:hypothetical protein
MKWTKMGLIYCPDGKYPWAKHTAMYPTPLFMEDSNILRIYVGFRDGNGVGRIGYVDVDADDPSHVLDVSKKPSLDIGVDGCFDDNGVIPNMAIKREGKLFLYYHGYQIPQKVKFLGFGGLAFSNNYETFARYKHVPIMDRDDEDFIVRVPLSMLYENGIWKVWYVGGSGFRTEGERILPLYTIKYTESDDGISFNKPGQVCIQLQGDEYRAGRCCVIRDSGIYKMFGCTATKLKGYRMTYAESKNGVNWERKDDEVGIDVSSNGWDSKMIGYPYVAKIKGKTFMFYNGNDYGKEGFGYAVLENE